jgi:nucleoside-diphosphate kinase
MALKGVDVINVVRQLAGVTNGREAAPGTIRGDYSMSVQENIVHASDSPETAALELARFFSESEIFTYPHFLHPFTYANDEL